MRWLSRIVCSKLKRLLLLYLILALLVGIIIFLHNHEPLLLNSTITNGKQFKNWEKHPGRFLDNLDTIANESYCNFMYNLPDDFSYDESDLEYSPELGNHSPYRVLYNVIKPKQNFSTPLTYATHLTLDFVGFIAEVVRIWEGPVSVAAFVSNTDADILTNRLIKLCQCLPAMSKISVHYVFPKNHKITTTKQESTTSTSVCHQISKDLTNVLSFGNRKSLIYPVNVCRNVARNASNTKFVLVSDVELMPSQYLASSFLKFVGNMIDKKYLDYPSRVFVVPVFEVDRYEDVPRNKKELLRLIKQEKAVYFHRYICSHCQKFPSVNQWLEQNPGNVTKIFAVTTRVYPYHRWEPIYIGTKDEPLYSEILSWEGTQDKMTQMLEMCLIGYRFLILDGVFLVHWPGIKRKSIEQKNRNSWRNPYQLKNARQYSNIIKKLATKYTVNPKCKLQ